MSCHACGVRLRKGTVCGACAGWQMRVGFECFICGTEIINSEERYLEFGNVCDTCTDDINRWYWHERANKYRKKK